MLDDTGFPKVKITALDALDTHVVKSLSDEGVPIDNFGIGERLITSSSSPVLGGVYKLAEGKINDQRIPKIKVSSNREKITLSGNKQVCWIYRQGNLHRVVVDVTALANERTTAPLKVANANSAVTYASQVLVNFSAKSLMQEYLGSNVSPVEGDLFKIQQFLMDQVARSPGAAKRLVNPDRYPVYLTVTLAELQERSVIKTQFTEEH